MARDRIEIIGVWPELKIALKRMAKENGRSVSKEAIDAFKEHIGLPKHRAIVEQVNGEDREKLKRIEEEEEWGTSQRMRDLREYLQDCRERRKTILQ